MSELNEMQEQVRKSMELLSMQNEALIRRCSAKDEMFAEERRVKNAKIEKLEREVSRLNRELRRGNATKPSNKVNTNVFG